MEKAHHPGGLAMAERQGPLRRWVGEGDAPLAVHPGSGIGAQEGQAQEGQDTGEHVMGLQELRWCRRTLCKSVELFPQLPCRR